ncbi:MAG: hypothetical protein AUK44_00035 [Porphyromonadaceae bacterium CG2_30_38_12]|nr:MAG: hypothetical protein AUK44_00035 [Porphyromonadaceae bacterium CG2_30_38_12]
MAEKIPYGISNYSEIAKNEIDIRNMYLSEMAYKGKWRNFFNYLAEHIYIQTSVRDFIDGEKKLQMFHLMYCNLANYYSVHFKAKTNAQLHSYTTEPRIIASVGKTMLHSLRVIYSGWEMVGCEEID